MEPAPGVAEAATPERRKAGRPPKAESGGRCYLAPCRAARARATELEAKVRELESSRGAEAADRQFKKDLARAEANAADAQRRLASVQADLKNAIANRTAFERNYKKYATLSSSLAEEIAEVRAELARSTASEARGEKRRALDKRAEAREYLKQLAALREDKNAVLKELSAAKTAAAAAERLADAATAQAEAAESVAERAQSTAAEAQDDAAEQAKAARLAQEEAGTSQHAISLLEQRL